MNYKIQILEDNNIPYIIIKKRFKRVSIKYNTNCILEIRQPLGLLDIEMIKFVEKHIDWIIVHKPIRPLPHEKYIDGDSYLLLGKEYVLKIVYSNHQDVMLCNNQIIVHTASDKYIEKLLEKFRFEQAEIVFNEILYRSFTAMKEHLIKYPTLTI